MATTTQKISTYLQSLKGEVLTLNRRNIKSKAYTRRENIKIFNMEENDNSSVVTEDLRFVICLRK